jgi:putative IMPACT (imprinted ancient) family translation regulator
MVNLMVVVTRYFGGVKLGVRGLIEAYGQAAGDVIAKSKRVLRTRSRRLVINLPYNIIGEVVNILEAYGTDVPTWEYGAGAEVSAVIRLSAAQRVAASLDEFQARGLIFSWKWLEDATRMGIKTEKGMNIDETDCCRPYRNRREEH